MKKISAFLTLLAVTLVLLACAHQQKEATQSPSPAGAPKGTLLVKRLPAGVEGVELKDGALRLKAGFKFVKKPRHQFAVVRMSGGQTVASGGCGCTGGTCDPVNQGSIIVCEGTSCTGKCGLALTLSGVKTRLIEF